MHHTLMRPQNVQSGFLAILAGCAATAWTVVTPADTRENFTQPVDYANHPENVWVKQSPRPESPSPRFGWEGSGAYDPYHQKWIHWGGHDGVPQGSCLFLWDALANNWEQKFPNTSPPGVCCVDGAQTFDLAHRRFVRFPGATLGHGWQWFRKVRLANSAVWLYDPTANRLGTESGPSPYALTIPSEPQYVLLREQGGTAEIKWQVNPQKGIVGYRVYKYGNPMKLVTKELVKEPTFTDDSPGGHARYSVVAVDSLGQEGEPSSPVWYGQNYQGFFTGDWHQ